MTYRKPRTTDFIPIETPQQAFKHLASNLRTRKDRIALDILIDTVNTLHNHDHFAKLFMFLFENGILAYGDSVQANERIKDILSLSLHQMTQRVTDAYNDLQTLKTCDENLISTDHLNPGGEENFNLMSAKDKKKIKEGVDFNIVGKKMEELINKALDVR